MYFPTDQITGLARTRFDAEPPDHEAVTDDWTYADGSKDFNEVSDNPPRRWVYEYTLVSRTPTDPLTVQIFDDFNNAARRVNEFYFTDKYGVTHFPVLIEKYSRTHEKNRPDVKFVTFNLVGYSSEEVTLTPPTVSLSSATLDGSDIEITGTVDEESDLWLFLNDIYYSTTADNGSFTLTVPVADLIIGTNTFFVRAVDPQGGFDTSNEVSYTVDVTAPSVPAGFSATKFSSTRIDLAWSASSDNVAVTGYQLRRATNSGFSTGVTDIDLGNVTSYSNTGLTPSTQYWYKVRAKDASGNYSAYSSADDDTTDAPPPIVLEYDLDLQSYSNNDNITSLTDNSGNAFTATNGGAQPAVFKTDDGNYAQFTDGGGAVNYLTVPDYTATLGSEAQLYVVLKAGSVSTKFFRLLGEGNQAAAFTEIFSGNVYEPFGSTTRKDNKTPTPLFTSGWVLYRIITKAGEFTMQCNGTTFFTTATNTFNKLHTNPFILGYTSNGSNWKMKYLTVLNNSTTNLTTALKSRFGIT